ncbi:MAG: hypothetical protein J6J41_02045 [Clostridia bacterium]|nr:hypothetical protein [Clostridia bacterium]
MKKIGRKAGAALLAAALLFGTAGVGAAEWEEETKNGKTSRRIWTDANGEIALSPEGYAIVTLSYSGTSVTEKYYDADGNPAQAAGGYYGRILTYGNKHRLEEIVYLDANWEKAACAEGYARVRISYTSAGGVTQAGYYDEANHLMIVPSLGYAQVKNDYRGTTLTKTTYLDAEKQPVDTPLGYAVMNQNVNRSNRVTGISFEHADGSPAVGPEGWAVMERELDKKNRETSRKYYDLSGAMTDRGLGYAYETKKWESDRVCVISRYSLENQQVPMGAGYVSLRRETNRDGQVIRETFLDETGAVQENTEGVASRKYTYDDGDRMVRVTFEGAHGDITEGSGGYAGYQETLNADGFVESRVYLGKGGKPVNTSGGYSEIRYAYDDFGRVSRTEYYDTNGNLLRQE